jgi:hypothetical protein
MAISSAETRGRLEALRRWFLSFCLAVTIYCLTSVLLTTACAILGIADFRCLSVSSGSLVWDTSIKDDREALGLD